jgi:2-amino-4-hydroxy-6-hydroxymethyldihydropteridine diphosphokinase
VALINVFIGLGSNLAEPSVQLAQAVIRLAGLPATELVAQSPFYRSRPVGPQDQPDFVNGAVWLRTALLPLALLDHLQAIEQAHGRERVQHWGPRTLDLDLLVYGHEIVSENRLTVPHLELPNRDFVLQPLLDLDPTLTLPNGTKIADLRSRCPDNQLRKLHPVPRNPLAGE